MAGDSFKVQYENWSKDYPISASFLNTTSLVGTTFAFSYAVMKICKLSPLYAKVEVISAVFYGTVTSLYNVIGTKYFGLQKHDVKAMEAATMAVVSAVTTTTLVAMGVIGFKGVCMHTLLGLWSVSTLIKESMKAQNPANAAV